MAQCDNGKEIRKMKDMLLFRGISFLLGVRKKYATIGVKNQGCDFYDRPYFTRTSKLEYEPDKG